MSKNNEQQDLKEKREMAVQVGRMLPEVIEKVDHYKATLKSEADLMSILESRQTKWYVSAIKKARERIEIIKLTNSILNKQKVFESYLARKTKYEKWLEEMAQEVQPNFKNVMAEAKEITTNIRLVDSIKAYESREVTPSLREKVEFYLYLKQEIHNHKKHGGMKMVKK